MKQITLQYSNDSWSTTTAQTFDVYSINSMGAKLYKRLHRGLTGTYEENIVGYYGTTVVDFAPLTADKTKKFYLYSFALAESRRIKITNDDVAHGNAQTYDTRDVIIDSDDLIADFADGFIFANSFTLTFIDKTLITATQVYGETMILRPTFDPTQEGISGNTLTLYVNLCDQDSVAMLRKKFSFIDEGQDDIAWGYTHKYALDIPPIVDDTDTSTGSSNGYKYSDKRFFLLEFCLCEDKYIDTQLIDNHISVSTSQTPTGGEHSVILDGDELAWDFFGNIGGTPKTALNLIEKQIRTSGESVPPVPIWDRVISDEFITY